MSVYRFHGYSDDLLHVALEDDFKEYGLYEDGIHIATAVFTFGTLRMRVVCLYDRAGTWCFAPAKYDEETPLLDADLTFYEEHPYCLALRVEVPDGTQFRLFDKDRKDITREGT